ncbi:MAG: OmpH family outer membrane protein [Acidobacteriota bacterium]
MINGDRVIAESNIGKTVSDQAQQKTDDWQARIDAKQVELDTMVRQRQEQALTLNQEALARMNSDIEERQVELQRMRDDAQRELQRLAQQLQAQVNGKLVPAVERLAQEDGYDLILDSRMTGILYFGSKIDVTERFIGLVNEGIGTGAQQQGDSE